MRNLVALHSALESHLASMPSVLPTQFENVSFNPVDGTPYQRVNIVLADPFNPEMGIFSQDNGYMQVTLLYPVDDGKGDALAMAQAISDWFPRGLSLSASGVTVTVERTASIKPGYIELARFALPVQMRFYSNNIS
jgi:hypothetical protein